MPKGKIFRHRLYHKAGSHLSQPCVSPLRLESAELNPPPGDESAQVGSAQVSHGIAPEYSDPRFNLSDENVPEQFKQELLTYEVTMKDIMVPMFGDGFDPVPKVAYVGVGILDGEAILPTQPSSPVSNSR